MNLESALDSDFFDQLEYRITAELIESNDPYLKGFWCDGLALSNNTNLLKTNLLNYPELSTTAWIGKDGQTEYQAKIILGKKAQLSLKQNISLVSCIPIKDSKSEWLEIDIHRRTVEIVLL